MVDQRGWVQHRRARYLAQMQDTYKFRVFAAREFKWAWRIGLLRNQPIVFSTWRIVHQFVKSDPTMFSETDFSRFLASVTSHSNIGGGLDPLNPIPGRTPEEAFDLAVGLLRRFKVVTVNSKILFNLLASVLDNVFYCANGVDCGFFVPREEKSFQTPLSVGWVGKIRGPKNFAVVEESLSRIKQTGKYQAKIIALDKDMRGRKLSPVQMRSFFQSLDFYLCASLNEGTPNPALEAAACGVPIVTTRVGNMPELINPGINGYFVEPTVQSVVERFLELEEISTDEHLKLRRNIRQSVEDNWSWERRIKSFVAAYDALTH